MKKTLFAMAALALCGTAVATEYKLSDHKFSEVGGNELNVSAGDVVVVDTSEKVGQVRNVLHQGEGSLTLRFDGNNVWNAYIGISCDAPVNITSTQSAAQNWINALASDTTAKTTIITFSYEDERAYGVSFEDVLFEGAQTGETFTLTGTTDTMTGMFRGFYTSPYKVPELNPGDLAVVRDMDNEMIYMTGKGLTKSPATPEPATATLSLMALAGMVTRRRRK